MHLDGNEASLRFSQSEACLGSAGGVLAVQVGVAGENWRLGGVGLGVGEAGGHLPALLPLCLPLPELLLVYSVQPVCQWTLQRTLPTNSN